MFTDQHSALFSQHKTPFYFYDLSLLQRSIDKILASASPKNYQVHYALKANCNSSLLKNIAQSGLGADCVSGNEIKCALNHGFPAAKIVFAGVGKTDEEILFALKSSIFCFNCESIQEIEVINELARQSNLSASIALRINPNVNAHTHHYITTGLEENKFGINLNELDQVIDFIKNCSNIRLKGLHFHIGSQITDMLPFKNLCNRVNEIQDWFVQKGFSLSLINLGGGLGINYEQPDSYPVPDFDAYFNVFHRFLKVLPNQEVHFELGRAIVGQCGSLISRVLYIKNGLNTNFVILDAGMTELIRPALYQAYHKIENLSRIQLPENTLYDIVGPICESSDCFGKSVSLPQTFRGDIIAIRSAGAYGEVMTSQYNLRTKNDALFTTGN